MRRMDGWTGCIIDWIRINEILAAGSRTAAHSRACKKVIRGRMCPLRLWLSCDAIFINLHRSPRERARVPCIFPRPATRDFSFDYLEFAQFRYESELSPIRNCVHRDFILFLLPFFSFLVGAKGHFLFFFLLIVRSFIIDGR